MQKKALAWSRKNLSYPARTTVAAVGALLAAQLLGLPEVYWAAITAIIVTQADLNSSLTMGWNRLAGTALGAAAGAALFGPGRHPAVFALGVFGVGVVSVLLGLQRPANRFAAIALTVVVLIPHTAPAWVVATHRFVEVSIGIVAGILLTAVWPEPAPVKI